MSKVDIDELVRWRDKCEALAASLQRKVRHCDEITEERDKAVRERDEALSRMEDLEADVRYYEDRWERIIGGAYIRGAEAMREAAAQLFDGKPTVPGLATMPPYADAIRALPISEKP